MDINITLLLQSVAFLLLIVFVKKVLWGPLTQAMSDRQRKIEEGLKASEEGQQQFEKAEEHARSVLAEAKQEAQQILEQANKREAEIIESAKESAIAEATKVRVQAEAQVEQMVAGAKEALRQELGALVIETSSKLIEKELDATAHQAVIESAAKRLAS